MRSRLPSLACLVLFSASALATEAPTPRTIVLVRHGHYAPDPKADEKIGPPLTQLGVAQARLAGARLAGQEPYDAIFVSPLQRARDTAAVIAADLTGKQPKVLADLEECTPPTWRTEVTKDEKPEDMTACIAQLDRVFAAHFQPASGKPVRELMVCHGNVIRYLITKTLKVDTKAWLEMSVGHASFTTIRVEADGKLRLIAAGDVGHLPPYLLTGALGDPERNLQVPQ